MPEGTEPPASTPPPISHAEAKDIATRLIAGGFRRDGERLLAQDRPRFSIPCRPHHDDDCLILAYIEQQAALAAQPPEPPDGQPRSEWAAVNIAKEHQRQADKEMIAKLERHLAESAPPQPGDAERRIRLLRIQGFVDSFADKHTARNAVSALDAQFLLDELDTAQSALAESRAEVERLKIERDWISATYTKFRQAAYDKLARLRSPTATGEDREAAEAFMNQWKPYVANGPKFTQILAEFRAASRSQGVREGIEMAAVLVETHVEGNHNGKHALSPKSGIGRNSINGEAYAAGIRALLSSPEPQP